MADILIRGMEMPTQCGNCPISTNTRRCTILWREFGNPSKRLQDCPLVPLPEWHGRLIDADSFKADCLAATKDAKPDFVRHEDWLKSCAVTMSFCRDIDERPTIVPAEGGTDDA